jgi:mannosyl-oligosaccharide alpha-1,3-glucosidase
MCFKRQLGIILFIFRYFTWDSVSFANPADMVANISAFGRKMVTIIDPHIRRDDAYYIYSEARSQNYLVLKNDGTVYEGWCWPG